MEGRREIQFTTKPEPPQFVTEWQRSAESRSDSNHILTQLVDRYDFVHFFIRNALGGTRNIDVPAARAQIERLKLPLSLVGAELEVITLSVRNGSQLTEEQMYRLEQMKAPLAEVEKNYFAIIEKYNLG